MKAKAEALYSRAVRGHICEHGGSLCDECDSEERDGQRWCQLDCYCSCHCNCAIPTEYDLFAAGYESPIERMLGDVLWERRKEIDPHSQLVASQVWVRGSSRLDFAVLRKPFGYQEPSYISFQPDHLHRELSVAVFCDGHDYHERTPEQAARDRRIDRELQLCGVGVLRFTGREIHRDKSGCVEQIIALHRQYEEIEENSYQAVQTREFAKELIRRQRLDGLCRSTGAPNFATEAEFLKWLQSQA